MVGGRHRAGDGRVGLCVGARSVAEAIVLRTNRLQYAGAQGGTGVIINTWWHY